jgi:hypothetical protein
MQVLSPVWRIGLPLVVVAGCALVLVSAVRTRYRRRDPEGSATAPQSKLDGGRAVNVTMPDLGQEITEGTPAEHLTGPNGNPRTDLRFDSLM